MERTTLLLHTSSLALAASAFCAPSAHAKERVEKNVVYGMHSGLALLMDVHHPAKSNGFGVVYVPGSAWHAPLEYGATQLKDLNTGFEFADRFNQSLVKPLVAAGYTVFIINHRAAPRFRYPAAVNDCQRAVRFIRHNAKGFAINAERIGGLGYSSGAHLVSLLGTMEGAGQTDVTDPVERQSGRLQCIVAGGTATDLTDLSAPYLAPSIASFLGVLTTFSPPQSQEYNTALEASPLQHVSPGDAPHLLFHGEKDEIIPLVHARRLAGKLREADVPVKLLVIPDGTHMNLRTPDAPDYTNEMLMWFDRYVQGE